MNGKEYIEFKARLIAVTKKRLENRLRSFDTMVKAGDPSLDALVTNGSQIVESMQKKDKILEILAFVYPAAAEEAKKIEESASKKIEESASKSKKDKAKEASKEPPKEPEKEVE